MTIDLAQLSLADYGRDTIAAGSKSFALASRVLSPAVRDDATMLYAYCRFADDLVDGQLMGHGQVEDYRDGQAERVAELRATTLRALSGETIGEPHYDALEEVVRRHVMPHRYVMELVDGFQMDADLRHYGTLEDTLDYGYHVAGVVGVMMAWIMGVRDGPTLDRASDLGIAFQLTNIARDVVDDARAGRVFVPSEMLLRHGAPVGAAGLAEPSAWPAAHRAALELLDVAEPYYASARQGVRELGFRDGWAILTALRVYREIGEKVRRMGPDAWAGRASTSTGRKLALATGALGDAAMRRTVRPAVRPSLYARPSP